MKNAPLQLPWTLETVPHAILDILRGCNIRCRDCYNLRPDRVLSLEEIDAQLDALTRLRKLQSISIVGGEITLHPNLVEIVRRVRQRGLFAELFTNGVDLNDTLLVQLKRAGANVIFLHIEPGQRRPDLSEEAGMGDLKRLRAEKVALVAAHGIEVGLAVTAYPEKPEEIEEAVAFTLESPHVSYLLATWWREVSRMPLVHGDLETGLFAQPVSTRQPRPLPRSAGFQPAVSPTSSRQAVRTSETCGLEIRDTVPIRNREKPALRGQCRDAPAPDGSGNPESCRALQERFGLNPFAFLGSNVDAMDPRWLSFMVATVHQGNRLSCYHSLQPTWVEKTFLGLSRLVTGRYPFYQPQHAACFSLHLLLNGLAGGGLAGKVKVLARASRPGARLRAKRFLFQRPAEVDERGRVVHCQSCPDAVVKDGRLVPLCICDRT
jgi:hypothetical protein